MWFATPNNKAHQITAAVILGILFVVIFLMINQISMSSSGTIKQKAFQISFSLLLLGPFVILYQRVFYNCCGPAVILWGVYGLSFLFLYILANNTSGSIPLMFAMLFIAFSAVVFICSFLPLVLKAPNDKPHWLTLLAVSITMFCSGLVTLEIIFNPIVI